MIGADLAVARIVESLGDEPGTMVAGWLFVAHVVNVDGDSQESHYRYSFAADQPHHAAVGLAECVKRYLLGAEHTDE